MMFDFLDTQLGSLLKKVQSISHSDVWERVFSDSQLQEQVLDWIRWDQLYNEGVDELGQIIGTYSRYTEILNPEKPEGSPYTLYDTGAFYESLVITVLSNAIEIDGDGLKTDEFGQTTDLFQEFGYEIIGLTDESKAKLAEELIERYEIELRKILSEY